MRQLQYGLWRGVRAGKEQIKTLEKSFAIKASICAHLHDLVVTNPGFTDVLQ